MLGVVEGYQTVLKTNCGDKLICIPLVYVKTGVFTHMIMGPSLQPINSPWSFNYE